MSENKENGLADAHFALYRDVNARMYKRSKANMSWFHWLIFAPFFFVAGLFRPETKHAFWNLYITVIDNVVYVPEKLWARLQDQIKAGEDPDWWYYVLVHERCHMVQQRETGKWRYRFRYVFSKKWRFKYEAEAYMTELFLHGTLGHATHGTLTKIAEKLGNENYLMRPDHQYKETWVGQVRQMLIEMNRFMGTDPGFADEIDLDNYDVTTPPDVMRSYPRSDFLRPVRCRLPDTALDVLYAKVEALYDPQ